jgi:hypothetical protein
VFQELGCGEFNLSLVTVNMKYYYAAQKCSREVPKYYCGVYSFTVLLWSVKSVFDRTTIVVRIMSLYLPKYLTRMCLFSINIAI